MTLTRKSRLVNRKGRYMEKKESETGIGVNLESWTGCVGRERTYTEE